MRVLILSHLFPSRRDAAAGMFVLQQAKRLRAAGIDTVVISPTPWAPRIMAWHPSVRKHMVVPRYATVDGFDVEHPRVPSLPKNRGFSVEGFSYYLFCRGLVRKHMLERGGFDLIHAHTIMPDGFGAVLLGRELNLPVVCTVHGSDIKVYPQDSRAVAWASKWALERVTGVIAVSEDLKRSVLAMADTCTVTVAHNGADPELFAQRPKPDARRSLGLPPDKKVISFVGYFRADKGLSYLLRAFARLQRRDVVLALVGDGPLKGAIMSEAEQLGIKDLCTFAGAQPHGNIPTWLCASDCLVLSSLTEGLPTILPEAMLCRVPVIATPVGGIPEIVRTGETGLLVPCRDAEAMSRAMCRVLFDTSFAAQLAERAYDFALNALTWKANAHRTISVYESALQSWRSVHRDSAPQVQSA